MASMEDIREGLATRLRTIPGVQVSPYLLGAPTPPALHVVPPSIEYDLAMGRGLDALTFTVQGFVAFGSDIGTQKRLDLWRAPTGLESVKTAIEGDKTLGGVVDNVHVRSSSEPVIVSPPQGGQLLSCDWEVLVYDTP